MPNNLRPDITLLQDEQASFLIEVFVTHRVGEEKHGRLLDAGLAGVEIAATNLFDQHGNFIYLYTHPLPVPESAWGLENAPRSLNVCPGCRIVSDQTATTAKVVDALFRFDPTDWGAVVAASGVSAAWISALAREPASTVTDLAINPENLRDKFGIPSPDMSPSDLEARLYKGFSLHHEPSASYWTSFSDLEARLFQPIAEHISDCAIDISGKMNALSDNDQILLKALELAEKLHTALSSSEVTFRARAWIGYGLLSSAYKYGNTNMIEEKLANNWPGQKVAGLTLERLDTWLKLLAKDKFVTRFKDGRLSITALNPLALKERGIVSAMKTIWAESKKKFPATRRGVYTALNRQQQMAVDRIQTCPITIVHGAAGTGKSHAISGIIGAFPSIHWILLAPTGKAAGRLRVTTLGNSNCSQPITVAKFLAEQQDDHRSDDSRAYGAILDEAGFISVETFDSLLKALLRYQVVRLVLAGDPGQLPSIGPGNVLGDLIKWARGCGGDRIAEVELLRVVRSADELTAAGHAVRRGIMPKFGRSITFESPEGDPMMQIVSAVRSLAQQFSTPVQVIAGTRDLVHELNLALQASYNPKGRPLECNQSLRVGDLIICMENYYGEVVMLNGQQATILAESEEGVSLETDSGHLVLPVAEIGRISLGYALTIHKAQGSEWDSVVVALSGPPPKKKGRGFVKRPLIYTAITRSKRHVHFIAQKQTLEAAIATESYRGTSLLYFLREDWK